MWSGQSILNIFSVSVLKYKCNFQNFKFIVNLSSIHHFNLLIINIQTMESSVFIYYFLAIGYLQVCNHRSNN